MPLTESKQKPADFGPLFRPLSIGKRTAPNKLVANPMEANDADDGGAPSERTISRYRELARGGWGVVFVEATSITPDSLGRPNGLVLNRATADGFCKMVRGFKQNNPDALILVQLTHTGIQSHPTTEQVTVIPNPPDGVRLLGSEDILKTEEQFVSAALLAEDVGFDGIDFKLCNGYLGCEFLRPSNTRKDEWGGSWENRTRFARESLLKITSGRKNANFIVGSRVSFFENRPGGCGTAGAQSSNFDSAESFRLIEDLMDWKIDYVNITGEKCGCAIPDAAPAEERLVSTLWYEHLAHDRVHKTGNGAMAVLGGGYTQSGKGAASIAASRIANGFTDGAGFGREIFANPHFPLHLEHGNGTLACSQCWKCASLLRNGCKAGCAMHNPFYRKITAAAKKSH